MAVDLAQYDAMGVDPFDAPIPGESLTSDPSTPKPWERPPQFTDVNEALHEIFMRVTDEEVYGDLMDAIREGTPIDMIVQTVLFKGYMNGAWNTDLLLTLIEPTMYIIIALAEQNKIMDYKVYAGEEIDLDEKEQVSMLDDDIKRMRPKVNREAATQSIPGSLLSQVKAAPMATGGEE